MSFVYGARFKGPETQVVKELKQELYREEYSKIDWNAARVKCTVEDLYYKKPFI